MKKRLVFMVDEMPSAQRAIEQARKSGIDDADISLIARSDKSDMIPDDRKVVEGDFYPAAAKGVVGGAVAGLAAGLIAVAIPPLGVTIAGALAMTVGGGALGAWSSALAGSAVDDPVTRNFEREVEEGHILVVVDSPNDAVRTVESALTAMGAVKLDFERPSAIT